MLLLFLWMQNHPLLNWKWGPNGESSLRSRSRCDAGWVLTSWRGTLSFLHTDEMWCQSSPWLYLLFTAQKDSEGERRVWPASSLHNTRCKQSTSFLSNINNHSRLATWLLLWLGERIHAEAVFYPSAPAVAARVFM